MVLDLAIIDRLCVVVLAAAQALHGRSFGGHVAGVVLVGFVSGLSAPLFRECLAGGGGVALVLNEFSAFALPGACMGALVVRRLSGERLFFWLDSLGMALAGGVAVMAGLMHLDFAGALVLAVLTGLMPGFVCDLAFGDVARFVEKTWYASALVMGCMLAMLLGLYVPAGVFEALVVVDAKAACVLAGSALVLGIRYWRSRLGIEA